MIVRDTAHDDVDHVLFNMREHCRREMLLTRPATDTLDELALDLDHLKPYALVRKALIPNGAEKPAAIFAAYRASPSVALFQTFSTNEWPAVAAAFPPWFVRAVAPQLRLAGIRMAEMNVIAAPPPNLRWFALQGAHPWGGPQPRGRAGELYQPMVWGIGADPLRTGATVDAALAALGSDPSKPAREGGEAHV